MKTVTLAYEYVDAEGNQHEPDQTLDLDNAEANRLLSAGLAREADEAPKTSGRRKAGGTDKEG